MQALTKEEARGIVEVERYAYWDYGQPLAPGHYSKIAPGLVSLVDNVRLYGERNPEREPSSGASPALTRLSPARQPRKGGPAAPRDS